MNRIFNKKQILTIPNLLSLFRLLLIPVIIWLYQCKHDYLAAASVTVLSGATDVIDGIVARKFNMVSDFGKILDPIADKLTQITVLFCLVSRFPVMALPLSILIVKEIIAAITNMLTIKKTDKVMGAVWHGKVTTILLYAMMIIHFIWFNIPYVASNILIGICTAMMLLSAILYGTRNIKAIRQAK